MTNKIKDFTSQFDYQSFAKALAINLALALVYFGLARLGLKLASINQSASPVWPATGFAISIVYLFGPRTLFAVALGAFTANYLTDGPLFSMVGISIGNTLEALAGALVLHKVQSYRGRLGDQTNTLAFFAASIFASLVSATIGVISLSFAGALPKEMIGSVWLTWWIGDALGCLVLTPVLIHFKKIQFKNLPFLGAARVLSFAAVVTGFVFFYSQGGPFVFLLFPVVLFAVYSLGNTCALVLTAFVCAVSIIATAKGFGPFSIGSLNERLVHLQLFLAAYSVSALVLSGFGKEKLKGTPTVALLFCWLLSGSIFYSFSKSELEKTKTHLENLIADAEEKTTSLIESYEGVLRGGVSLFNASKSIEYDEWKAYNQTLNITAHHPGMHGLGFIAPVHQKDLKKLQREMKDQGLPDFEVKNVPGVKSVELETGMPRYVIKFVEPRDLNKAAFGLDIGSESNRRGTADQSRDSGLAVMTSIITLVQDREMTPGGLYFLPVYKKNAPQNSPEERQRALLGWVYSPIVYKNFFTEVFSRTSNEIELQAFEGSEANDSNLVFSNFSENSANTTIDGESKIQLGQKIFLLRWARSPHFISSHSTVIAWVGLCAAFASLLLAYLIVTIQSVGRRSRELADELTEELSASREKFQQGERRLLYALDGSNDGIWDWNIEKGEMYVSGKIALTHGWPTTFQATSVEVLRSFAYPDDLKKLGRSIKDVLLGNSQAHEVETRYRTTSGEWRWVLTRGKVSERDANGKATRMTGVLIDIHELKRTQDLFQSTQYKLASIANSVPAMVSLWKKDLKCEFANELFGKWFGLSSEQIIGAYMKSFVPAWELEARLPMIQRAIDGEHLSYELEAVRPVDKQKRVIISTYMPYMNEGVNDGFFLFIQDITELKKAELDAIEKQKVAVEALNVKSQFLANMSHEIRTPLNGIVGMTRLMKGTNLNPKQKDYADTISRSSDTLLNLINDILDFSKVEAGKMELEVVDFDLRTLISDLVKTFSFSVEEKNLMMSTHMELGPCEVFKGDPGRIRQILSNLVSNAIKFTSKGSVSVSVVATTHPTESTLRFEIVDSGIGIPKEAIGKMFKAFSQADSSTTRRFGGTGLGLSICKQLVDLMGGEIGIESEPSRGSKFWFSLTLPHGEMQEKDLEAKTFSRTLGARILVVEDNRVNQQIAIEVLEQVGYKPHAVGNGIEALDALRESPYDIVLMDCQMPEMDGFRATEIIRQSDSLNIKRIPIIAMTANALKGDKEKCLAVGMTDYVSKPVDEAQLVLKIERCLSEKQHSVDLVITNHKNHILVVEDNKVNQTVISLNLESLGYTFDVANNGVEALKYLSTQICDLILMDCQMPEMDGFEATRNIRLLKDKTKSNIPIVALTANAMKGDRERCLDAGMNDFLTKPLDVEALSKSLDKWLQKNSSVEMERDFAMTNKNSISAIDIGAIEKLKKLQKPGRPSLLTNLITLYFESAHESMKSIRTSAQKNDLQGLSAAAHSLKSSSANLGAQAFADICLELEKLGEGEVPAEKLNELILSLEDEFVKVLSELEGFKVAA